MKFQELVTKSRTRRRFDGTKEISTETLRELVELARLCPSSGNSQALKFKLVNDRETCKKVYDNLTWAAALPDWDGPSETERPTAYIVILCDQSIAKQKPVDDGICAQTIMLGAAEKGLGGCIFAGVNREGLSRAFHLDRKRYQIDLVLALGVPIEEVRLTELPEDGSLKYYRDENGVHYVPKRSLSDLILE